LQGCYQLKGKYAKKRERQQHKDGSTPTTENNKTSNQIAESQPEKRLTAKPEEMDMLAMRRWVRGLNATEIAILGLLITVFIAGIYFFQLRAMRDTVTAMEKQTRLSVRSWIGLEDTLNAIHNETPLQIDSDGNASIVYKIVAKNYSSSTPATNVFAFANLVLADDTKKVYDGQGVACGDAEIGKPDIGQVLFPGKLTNFAKWPSYAKISSEHENGLIGIWLAGCIGYRDQFNYLCRTSFMWYFQPDDDRVLKAPVPAQTITGHFVASESGNAIDTCQIAKYNYGEGLYKDKPKKPN
jgi:hypothetical protein